VCEPFKISSVALNPVKRLLAVESWREKERKKR